MRCDMVRLCSVVMALRLVVRLLVRCIERCWFWLEFILGW